MLPRQCVQSRLQLAHVAPHALLHRGDLYHELTVLQRRAGEVRIVGDNDFRIQKVNSRRWVELCCCVVSHDSCGWLRCESTCIVSLCKAAGVLVCWREQGVPVVFTMYCVYTLYGLDACHLPTQRVHRVCSSLHWRSQARRK